MKRIALFILVIALAGAGYVGAADEGAPPAVPLSRNPQFDSVTIGSAGHSITRDGDDMVFTDPNNSEGVTLSELLAGEGGLVEGDIDTIAELNTILTDFDILDWSSDQGATNIHAGNIPDLSGTYQSASAVLSTYAGINPSADIQTFLGYANFAAIKGGLSLDDLVTLSGVADGSTHLGDFTGSTITDNVTIKAALQLLETAIEGVEAGGLSDLDDLPGDTTDNNLIDSALIQMTGFDDITWGAAAGTDQTWTFDTGSGTDPSIDVFIYDAIDCF